MRLLYMKINKWKIILRTIYKQIKGLIIFTRFVSERIKGRLLTPQFGQVILAGPGRHLSTKRDYYIVIKIK